MCVFELYNLRTSQKCRRTKVNPQQIQMSYTHLRQQGARQEISRSSLGSWQPCPEFFFRRRYLVKFSNKQLYCVVTIFYQLFICSISSSQRSALSFLTNKMTTIIPIFEMWVPRTRGETEAEIRRKSEKLQLRVFCQAASNFAGEV